MKNILFIAVLAVLLLIFAPGDPSAGGFAAEEEILFISSYEELGTVLIKFAKGENIKGLAVSAEFYGRATEGTKNSIRSLIDYLLMQKFRPVFVYGQPLDVDLVKELLGREIRNCHPPVVIGTFPTVILDDSGDTVIDMCLAYDKPLSEKDFRRIIPDYWKKTKEQTLKNFGCKVPE